MARSDDCASGLHDYCGPCDCECHGEYFSKEEILAFWRIIAHQYISYEDVEAQKATTRLVKLIQNYELGSKSS